jgi:pimeloyl-ACP methyl ester carboxylesterase
VTSIHATGTRTRVEGFYDRGVRAKQVIPHEIVTLPTGREVQTYHLAPTAPDAAPALYVHGLGGSSSNWWLLMPHLADTFDQWAFDLPGFGDSPPSSPHTVQAYADDVIAFAERRAEEAGRQVHLIGNSMGGMISVIVAATRPDLVDTLTLVAPAMPQRRLPSAARGMAVAALPAVGERLLARVNGVSAEEQVQRLLRVTYADPASVDADDLAWAIEERRRRMDLPHADAVVLEALRSIVVQYLLPTGRSAWRTAGRILAPTLVLVGGHDALVGAWSARRWRRTLPRSRVVELSSSGHAAMMEHSDVVADHIRSFLTDIRQVDTLRPGSRRSPVD